MVTEQEVKIGGTAPVVEPVAAPEASAAPIAEAAPAAEPEMPKTASNLALVALLGLALIVAGAALWR